MNSRIWQGLAVLFGFSLLYIGHGLHQGGSDGLPTLVGTAQAGGVAVSTSTGTAMIYTASEDGQRLYIWQANKEGMPQFVGTRLAKQ